MNEDDFIKIEIPEDVEKRIKGVDNVSETLKLRLRNGMKDLVVQKVKKTKKSASAFRKEVKDIDDKIDMLFEIALDRFERDSYITQDEVIRMMEAHKKHLAAFITAFKRLSKTKGYDVKRCQVKGKTCYKLII